MVWNGICRLQTLLCQSAAFQDVSQSLSLNYTESNSPTTEAMAFPMKEPERHQDDILPP